MKISALIFAAGAFVFATSNYASADGVSNMGVDEDTYEQLLADPNERELWGGHGGHGPWGGDGSSGSSSGSGSGDSGKCLSCLLIIALLCQTILIESAIWYIRIYPYKSCDALLSRFMHY